MLKIPFFCSQRTHLSFVRRSEFPRPRFPSTFWIVWRKSFLADSLILVERVIVTHVCFGSIPNLPAKFNFGFSIADFRFVFSIANRKSKIENSIGQ